MLTGRTVIVLVVLVAALSLLGATVSLLRPPDRGGLAEDSYGTRADGYRAIFEILAALGIDVQRGLGPPDATANAGSTLVLWAPDAELVRTEPTYLQRVGQWVKQGGRVVIALPAERKPARRIRSPGRMDEFLKPTTASEELGLPPIHTGFIDLSEKDKSGYGSGGNTNRISPPAEDDRFGTPLRDILNPPSFPIDEIQVRGEGDFAELSARSSRLEVPQRLQVLTLNDAEPDKAKPNPLKPVGTIRAVTDDGESPVLVAQYELGAGRIVVVSDPAIFDNRLIGRADNSVLAVDLLAGGGRSVAWDEFYHGLTIRGNPFFLLTRAPYAILATMILLATTAWIWRQSRFLGPPLAAVGVSRRTLAEYVEATARFFNRGSASGRFLVEEIRRGVLWSLRRKVGTRHDRETLEGVAAAVARRDPQGARRLLEAAAGADRLISQNARPKGREVLQAVKELIDCL